MVKQKPIVKPEEEKVYTPQQLEWQAMQKFASEYQKLCEKHQYRIVITPVWTARDDGSWSLFLQTSVGKLPELTEEKRSI